MLENDFFTFSLPVTLTFDRLDLEFAPLVTLVQRYVFTRVEVSTAFLFWENRRHGTDGQTDRWTGRRIPQHLTRPPTEGHIISV